MVSKNINLLPIKITGKIEIYTHNVKTREDFEIKK
jgi:hypothetical protein